MMLPHKDKLFMQLLQCKQSKMYPTNNNVKHTFL